LLSEDPDADHFIGISRFLAETLAFAVPLWGQMTISFGPQKVFSFSFPPDSFL